MPTSDPSLFPFVRENESFSCFLSAADGMYGQPVFDSLLKCSTIRCACVEFTT